MMANQWERAVVLRLGRLQGIKGPGLFIIIPIVDTVATWIDQRIQTTEFNAEQALSKDTVPVNVDAVVFWQVHDPERAALEITDYREAIGRVAQTSLREMVGSSPLAQLLSDRKNGDELLRAEIGRKTADWGVSVMSVEMRDISVPPELQDAMSRQAQAERELLARVMLGDAEKQIASKFVEAADIYAKSPAALELRAMNIIYETTKERGATILMPTSMVNAMNPIGMLGLAAATRHELARSNRRPVPGEAEMLRPFMAAACALAAALAFAAPAMAEDAAGDWTGVITTPAATLHIAVHIHATGAGAYAGAVDSPDQGAFDVPIDPHVVASADHLSFDVPADAWVPTPANGTPAAHQWKGAAHPGRLGAAAEPRPGRPGRQAGGRRPGRRLGRRPRHRARHNPAGGFPHPHRPARDRRQPRQPRPGLGDPAGGRPGAEGRSRRHHHGRPAGLV